ncbi:probable cytochrome P450 4d14 [Anopheles aquasalis]|uniref:probable cytochrome P450 4d14 n=1 Tax=Anopheles aquasalis TaxID=42839 RepID=UPI00215A4D34|nr:probable cytochrome P450 4d14 [Anopheles aquasalis]
MTLERIISSNEYNRKSDDYDVLQEWLGNGILLDHGNSWFTNRRALTGAFHFKILDSYVPVFEEQANVLVRKLLASAGQPVDIFPIAKLYTLDVILETSMGVQCQAQIKDSAYGHDTTSSAITFILYSCAKHPDIQQRVYEEIIAEIPTGKPIDQQCINNLKYLDLVIKESLRMFPPVPYYSRSIDKEVTFNGIRMLKGSSIICRQS